VSQSLSLQLSIELIAVELGRCAVRFDPQVELKIDIPVIVLTELD
jgi:hypothetical protein